MSKQVTGESSKKRKVSEKTSKKSIYKEAMLAYSRRFKHCDVILERGIDLETCSPLFKELIEHYHWEKLVKPREEDINFTIVAEFYAFLAQIPEVESVQELEFRKAKVPFTPEAINIFFGIPEVPHDQIYSVVWELDEKNNQRVKSREAQQFINPRATWQDGRFKIGGASAEAKMLKHLLAFNIVPHSHTSDINASDACLIYAILTKQPVDLGVIIHREAHKVAISLGKTVFLPFPGLIHDLCINAGVKVQSSDLIMKPSSLKIAYKGNRERGPRAGPSISEGGPSVEQPFPPQGSYFNDPALVARLDNMEASIGRMGRGMEIMNDNMSRAFERNRQWCDDIRTAIRGQRDLSMAIYDQDTINLDDFDTCQPDPYTMSPWDPIYPTPAPTFTTAQSFGTRASTTFAGMAPGSVPISGLTTGFGGMSLQGSTVVSTQFGAPYTGSLQTLASVAAQAASPNYFDPSLFSVSGVSLLPCVPFPTATLPPESAYRMPSPDDAYDGLNQVFPS